MAAIIGGALGSSIPNIFGGFAPFPNTIATALLAYQSEAIGYGFGIKFQYSKRLIGAMTNEEFNALTPFTIGQIVESHNTELINRMKIEMPKWLDIQRHFIEASVEVEIAKANRTPSAWAEIIQAFSGGATQQIADSLDSLDSTALGALLAANPILALIYSFSKTGGGTQPPDEDVTPPAEIGEPLPIHEEDESPFHTIEEHEEDTILQNQLIKTALKIVWLDPGLGSNKTYITDFLNHAQHHVLYISIQNDTENKVVPIIGAGSGSKANFLHRYNQLIENKYLHL